MVINYKILLFALVANLASSQIYADDKIERMLTDLASAEMPSYETKRKAITRGISLGDLNEHIPSEPSSKAMLPIIKLYKEHEDIVKEFNDLWENDSFLKAIGKSNGNKRNLHIDESKPSRMQCHFHCFIPRTPKTLG